MYTPEKSSADRVFEEVLMKNTGNRIDKYVVAESQGHYTPMVYILLRLSTAVTRLGAMKRLGLKGRTSILSPSIDVRVEIKYLAKVGIVRNNVDLPGDPFHTHHEGALVKYRTPVRMVNAPTKKRKYSYDIGSTTEESDVGF